MPIYEYKCRSCEHQFETIQKFSDDPLTECPACKQHELKKLVSAAAFHLKGNGWYATDFKNGNNKDKADETEKSASEKESKSETSEPSNKVDKDAKKSTDSDTKSSSSQSSVKSDVA